MLTTYLRKLSQSYNILTFLKKRSDPNKQFKKILHNKAIIKTGSLKPIAAIVEQYQLRGAPAAETYCEVANFLVNTGQPELAQRCYKYSLDLALVPSTYSLYLQCLAISPNCNEKMMHQVASKYSKLFLSHVKKHENYTNVRRADRTLNVGYVCHFFHNSVSQSLLIPFLRAHNRKRVKIFCYSDTDCNEVDNTIKNVADVWRDTKALNDVELSSMIRNDQIDILLELNGHCVVNRYGVLANKPAPVQVSYYNQLATSGISTMDYALIGDEVIHDKSQPNYSESIYLLKGVSGVAIFPDTFPACSPPPCLKNGYVTFGSFGAAHKVNTSVIRLWCKILKKIPTARFYMKAAVLTHAPFVDAYTKMFKDEGIDASRVCFEGFSEHHAMLACYAKMDIALDTFPYAAGTTSMEATWQGVPVITLSGEGFAGQNGKSIHTSIGHPELIAYSEKEYINKAVSLAADTERLMCYRQTLREDFRKSPRADAVAFAAQLEDAYCDMWNRYCQKERIN